MEYTGSVVWPPRPRDPGFPPSRLEVFSNMGGQSAQVKMNGTGTVVYAKPDRTVFFKTRHNEDHKQWSPIPDILRFFRALSGNAWYVFIAELLHSKVTGGPRNVLYIHEMIVADGDCLISTTFVERQLMLYELFLGSAEGAFTVFTKDSPHFGDEHYTVPQKALETTISHHVLTPNIWLARNYTGDFAALFKALDKPEHEGLVLKTFNAKLAPCTRQSANSDWQSKSRRVTDGSTVNYSS